uniref:Uncharacterized protein n=1 Tax=Anguilla anguilla TaxID=7936 RepID=A0A0E9URF4_ANGAN
MACSKNFAIIYFLACFV